MRNERLALDEFRVSDRIQGVLAIKRALIVYG